MVMVVLTISVADYCRSAHATEPSVVAGAGNCAVYSDVEKQCPLCPMTEQTPDHCNSFCQCPCHASPLTSSFIEMKSFRFETQSFCCEPIKTLPEVYLPTFVPPHILA